MLIRLAAITLFISVYGIYQKFVIAAEEVERMTYVRWLIYYLGRKVNAVS
jgi:hypothetical protein